MSAEYNTIPDAKFHLATPLQMIDRCGWSISGSGYSEAGCGSSGWLDPDDYDDFKFCPFCGREVRILHVDGENE